jgi:hypothetical protein
MAAMIATENNAVVGSSGDVVRIAGVSHGLATA